MTTDTKPTLVYETLVEAPIDDERVVWMIEKIREVAYPLIHVKIEAADRRELARRIAELNVELESWGLPPIDVEGFSRGTPGSLFGGES